MAQRASRKRIFRLRRYLFLLLVSLSLPVILLSGCSPEGPRAPLNGLCEALDNALMRDMCYRDSALEAMLANLSGGSDAAQGCYQIRNPLLQYLCFRPGSRPYMLTLMSRKDPYPGLALSELPDECTGYDEYHALFCIYTHAAGQAQADVGESERICALLGDEMAEGECLSYVASALAMDIEKDTKQKVSVLAALCGRIESPAWKSECFYVLADELALFRPEAYVAEIADACIKSNNWRLASLRVVDYDCFPHVAYLLPAEKGKEMCLTIDDGNYREDCAYGVGISIGDLHVDDAARAGELCDEFPEDLRGSCFSGLGWGFGLHFIPLPAFLRGRAAARDIGGAVGRCSELSPGSKSNCFSTLGTMVGDSRGSDVESVLEDCGRFPAGYEGDCVVNAASQVGANLANDVPRAVETCGLFPGDAEAACLISVAQMIGLASGTVEGGTESCYLLPDEHRVRCLEHLSARSQ